MERQVLAFLESKALSDVGPAYAPVIEKHLRDVGIFDLEPAELIQLERVYQNYKQHIFEMRRNKSA